MRLLAPQPRTPPYWLSLTETSSCAELDGDLFLCPLQDIGFTNMMILSSGVLKAIWYDCNILRLLTRRPGVRPCYLIEHIG